MDPEVVTQFDCLQQTGNFCPSSSNGPAAMSGGGAASPTTTGARANPRLAATDAFFALMGTPDDGLGSPGISSPSPLGDPFALTLA